MDLNKILEQVCFVEEDSIENMLSQSNMFDNMTLELLEENAYNEFRYQNKYCSKTGKFLGKIDKQEFASMWQIHGEHKTIAYYKRLHQTYVDPIWIYTDSAALEQLKITKPADYFVYAAEKICRINKFAFLRYGTQDLKPALREKLETEIFNMQIKLHAYLSTNINLYQIAKANEILYRYLALIHSGTLVQETEYKKFESDLTLAKIIDNFTPWVQIVEDITKQVITTELKKHKHLITQQAKAYFTFADIVAIKEKYKGHSNIRGQKSIGNMSEIAILEQLIKPLIPTTAQQTTDLHTQIWLANLKAKETESKKRIDFNTKNTLKLKKSTFKFGAR